MKDERARNWGVELEGQPGPWNDITDVGGVEVGYATIIHEHGPARTGVTALHPRGKASADPVFAGGFALNGNGEMTGMAWVEESGFLEGPLLLTNTHSVGLARDAVIEWQVRGGRLFQPWSNPVVAETYDGYLNDINGFHVRAEHVWQALDSAASGPIAQGNVGGGTGMICYECKGGTGSASRVTQHGWRVGALVQANFGARDHLRIGGAAVGRGLRIPRAFSAPPDHGSLIAILATDAPLLPHQLKRLAKRGALGMARTGGLAGNSSGDLFLAFSTANPGAARLSTGAVGAVEMLSNEAITPLFNAAAYAVEEAILNSLAAAEDMTGLDGHTVWAVRGEEVRALL